MFTLDSRLQQDCLLVGDFPLCRLLLMNDASYPWFILVPRREEVSEIFQLDGADQRQGRCADQQRERGEQRVLHRAVPARDDAGQAGRPLASASTGYR